MSKINSHTNTLFHFTRNEETILSILKEGLRFGYCKERFNEEICIGIPMISFCDIPINNIAEHKNKYGNYAIGLSKSQLIEDYSIAIGPVNYYTSKRSINAAFKLLKLSKEKKDFLWKVKKSIKPNVFVTLNGNKYEGGVLPKENAPQVLHEFWDADNLYQAATFAIGLMKPYESEGKEGMQINYDECEWRMVMPEYARLSDNKLCYWYWSEKELEEWREQNGSKFIDDWSLPIELSCINYLLVPDSKSVLSIVEHIQKMDKLYGKKLSNTDKSILCAKVLSFEQIEDDF